MDEELFFCLRQSPEVGRGPDWNFRGDIFNFQQFKFKIDIQNLKIIMQNNFNDTKFII